MEPEFTSKPKGFFFPDIKKLESSDPKVRYMEEAKAQASLKVMADKDTAEERRVNTLQEFGEDFVEGFATPFKWMWNSGNKTVKIIDETLDTGGKVIGGFKWLTEHPLLFMLIMAGVGSGAVIIVKKVIRD